MMATVHANLSACWPEGDTNQMDGFGQILARQDGVEPMARICF